MIQTDSKQLSSPTGVSGKRAPAWAAPIAAILALALSLGAMSLAGCSPTPAAGAQVGSPERVRATPPPPPRAKSPSSVTSGIADTSASARATPTPVPPTPVATPAPVYVGLNLRIANPDLGTVTVEPLTPDNRYPKGTSVTITAEADPGNKFSGWSGDFPSTAQSLSIVMDSNRNIQGGFTKLAFTLTASQIEGGTISFSPNSKTFDYGVNVTATAAPAPGFVFKSWTGDGSGPYSPLVIKMDRNKTIGAEFVRGEYTLSAKVNPNGFIDIQPAGSRFAGGTVVTLTARTPINSNYRFGSWSGDATGTNPTITVTMDSNKSIVANFIREYTLSVEVSPAFGGTVTPNYGSFDDGTAVALTATPNPGWRFAQWAGQATGTGQKTTVIMNWDKGVLAVFEQVQ